MMPIMARKKTDAPVLEPGGIVVKRRRAKRSSPPKTQWTPEEARKFGPMGGRPKGSITSPFMTVSAFMMRVFRDPDFQNNFLWRAQNGLLTPAEIQNMCYFVEGRPTYKVEVTKPVDPDEEVRRLAFSRMPLAERRAMTDLIRKFNALREEAPAPLAAIPQATATVTKSEDAEITEPAP